MMESLRSRKAEDSCGEGGRQKSRGIRGHDGGDDDTERAGGYHGRKHCKKERLRDRFSSYRDEISSKSFGKREEIDARLGQSSSRQSGSRTIARRTVLCMTQSTCRSQTLDACISYGGDTADDTCGLGPASCVGGGANDRASCDISAPIRIMWHRKCRTRYAV